MSAVSESSSSSPLSLPWEQQPIRELLRLAGPTAVSMLSYSAMTLVGTAFVSRLGPSALAGMALAGTLVFFMVAFSLGLFRGLKTLVSQAVGARQLEALPAQLCAGLVLALITGVVTVLMGQLFASGMPALSSDPQTHAHARSYLHLRNLAAPAVVLAAALREFRYGMGDARSGMVASLVANAVNAGLDYAFLVHWKTGVEGAAWAAMAAHVVEMVVLLEAQRRSQQGLALVWRRQVFADVWRVGWPTGVQFLLEVGSFAVLTALVAGMGDAQMAAHQIALNLIHVSFLPAWAIAQACSVLVGQAVGARREALVPRLAHRTMWIAGAYTAFCSFVFAVGGGLLAGAFDISPVLHAITVRLLWVAAVFQVLDGAALVARGVLQGAADVRFAAVTGVLISWLVLPPLVWTLGIWGGLGAVGAWLALCAEIGIAAALFWVRLERGQWKAALAHSA